MVINYIKFKKISKIACITWTLHKNRSKADIHTQKRNGNRNLIIPKGLRHCGWEDSHTVVAAPIFLYLNCIPTYLCESWIWTLYIILCFYSAQAINRYDAKLWQARKVPCFSLFYAVFLKCTQTLRVSSQKSTITLLSFLIEQSRVVFSPVFALFMPFLMVVSKSNRFSLTLQTTLFRHFGIKKHPNSDCIKIRVQICLATIK